MKRIIAWLCVALAALLLLSACSSKVIYDDQSNTYADKKTGQKYLMAGTCFEPVSYNVEKEYGTLVVGVGEFALFAVKGVEEGTWLATELGDVMYREDQTLPTLATFDTSRIYICREDEKIHAFNIVEDESEIDSILDLYLNGTSIEYPSLKTPKQNLRLRLGSDTYKHLYYKLIYLEYAEDVIVYGTDAQGNETEINYGKYFIYSREEDRCVPVGDTIHKYVGED